MMNKLCALFVLSTAIATTGFTTIAAAETWSPTGPITLSDVGLFNLQAGLNFTCGLSGSATLDGMNATVTSLALTRGSLFCPLFPFLDLPYTMEPSSLNSVTLQNVRLVTIYNECAGDLTGAFDQATGRITFVNATIPSDPLGGPPCILNGVLATTPQASYTIP